jgi:PAS domain S-box-containing protein
MRSGEAALRPLGPPDRWRRLWPYAAVALLGYALAWLTPRVDGALLAAAIAAGVALLAVIGWTTARRGDGVASEILERVGFFVIVLDAQGRVVTLNRGCEALTGDLTGRHFWSLLPNPHDASTVRKAFENLAVAGFPDTVEHDWTTAEGRRRRILWSTTTLTGRGGVTHVVGTGIDVTEQRHTERLFADVLGAPSEQAIIATNASGMITVFNAGAERLLGYPAAEVVGLLTLDRFHQPEELVRRAEELGVPAPEDALYAPARQGQAETRQWTYLRRDGGLVPVALTVSAMRDDLDEITGYLGVARDVTQERRRVEAMAQALDRERTAAGRLRELDKVRGDLVATVSHELRTPLTSILGNLELLVDGDAGVLQPAQARLLTAVERNARRLLALIEDLLMLSRIESGAVKINARPVLIRAIVAGALEALDSVRATRQVSLAVDLPDEPIIVYGDRAQLERVVINLVDNALKFTPSGGRARVSVDDADGELVRLTVTDTGIGIPEDEIDHIFEQFFRSSRSQERQSQGTGLGLAITKSIVERHGGRIWARPANGAGTVVTCLLPRPPELKLD